MFSFQKPAVYKIKVAGEIDINWMGNLGGMQLKVQREGENKVTSVLIGEIADQSALNGILNGLYDLHLSVLSVKILDG